jgi:hypothetical protein
MVAQGEDPEAEANGEDTNHLDDRPEIRRPRDEGRGEVRRIVDKVIDLGLDVHPDLTEVYKTRLLRLQKRLDPLDVRLHHAQPVALGRTVGTGGEEDALQAKLGDGGDVGFARLVLPNDPLGGMFREERLQIGEVAEPPPAPGLRREESTGGRPPARRAGAKRQRRGVGKGNYCWEPVGLIPSDCERRAFAPLPSLSSIVFTQIPQTNGRSGSNPAFLAQILCVRQAPNYRFRGRVSCLGQDEMFCRTE